MKTLQTRFSNPLHLNSLPNDKMIDWPKLKAFADDKIKILKMMNLSLIRLKTLWEKEKMLVINICPFSTMFSMGFLPRVIKSQDCRVKS